MNMLSTWIQTVLSLFQLLPTASFDFFRLSQAWSALAPRTTKELIRKKNAFKLNSSRDKTCERRLEEVQALFAKGTRMMNMLFEVAQQTSRHRLNYSRLYLIWSKPSATRTRLQQRSTHAERTRTQCQIDITFNSHRLDQHLLRRQRSNWYERRMHPTLTVQEIRHWKTARRSSSNVREGTCYSK